MVGAMQSQPKPRVTRRSAERAGWRIIEASWGRAYHAYHAKHASVPPQTSDRVQWWTLQTVLHAIGRVDPTAFAPTRRRVAVPHTAEQWRTTTAPTERQDCAVRATAIAACEDYEVTAERYRVYGRIDRTGTSLYAVAAVMRELGACSVYVYRHLGNDSQLTLAQLLKDENYRTGHYVCLTANHAFAVCDGVVHDYAPRGRCRLTYVWKLC